MPLQFNPFTGTFDVTTKGDTGTVAAAGDGTAALPGIAFANDLDSGIYRVGANSLGISTGGTGRLFVDASGNVGVGTANASAQVLGASASKAVAVAGAAGGSVLVLGNDQGSVSTNARIELNGVTSGGNPRQISYIESLQTATNGAGALVFGTHGGTVTSTATERMRLDSSGRLGVGTSSPSAPLTVVASSNNTDVAIFNGSTGTSRGLKLSTGTNFNSDALVIYDAQEATYGAHLFRTRGTNALFIDQSQRVGIGTTSPSYLLDCAGDTRISGTNGLRIEGGGTGTQFYNNAGGTILDSFTASTSLRLLTQSTERARIDSSGRLLVGTSTSTNNIRLQESFAVVNKGQGTLGGASLTSYSGTDSSARALIDFQRSRGITDGSMTVVASGDDLGSVVWRGADGTNFIDSAVINAQVDGTPGANDMPGRLVFSTTADGASSPTPRMTIKSSGIVNITNTPTYADNTAALAGGLVAGDIYRKSDGTLMITY